MSLSLDSLVYADHDAITRSQFTTPKDVKLDQICSKVLWNSLNAFYKKKISWCFNNLLLDYWNFDDNLKLNFTENLFAEDSNLNLFTDTEILNGSSEKFDFVFKNRKLDAVFELKSPTNDFDFCLEINPKHIKPIYTIAMIMNQKFIILKHDILKILKSDNLKISLNKSILSTLNSSDSPSSFKHFDSSLSSTKTVRFSDLENPKILKKKLSVFTSKISNSTCQNLRLSYNTIKTYKNNHKFLLIRMCIIFDQYLYVKKLKSFNKLKILQLTPEKSRKYYKGTEIMNSFSNPRSNIKMLPTYYLTEDSRFLKRPLNFTLN